MTARLTAALLHSLLALLLLAGVPTLERAQAADGHVVRLVENALLGQGLQREPFDQRETGSDLRVAPECADDGDGPDPLLIRFEASAPLDLARLVRIGRPSYATAPPSHRPCAAPPTGPPFV